MFKKNANPVGVVHKIDAIEEKLLQYSRMWDELKNPKTLWKTKVDLSQVTNFLLFALDDFITTVCTVAISGPDKKATVLDAVDRLYEYAVREALPLWLIPIAGPIKSYIVYVLVSNAIDWIVAKYQSGSWKREKKAWDGKYVPCRLKKEAK